MLKEWFTIKEIIDLKIEKTANRKKLEEKIRNDMWIFRSSRAITKPVREYHISNFPRDVREKIVIKLLAKYKVSNSKGNVKTANKSIEIAYARFEIIQYIKNNNITKQEFIKVYNSKKVNINTYTLIEKISKIML